MKNIYNIYKSYNISFDIVRHKYGDKFNENVPSILGYCE